MPRKKKILVILLAVFLILTSYLILSSALIKNKLKTAVSDDRLEARQSDYQEEVKRIFSDYEKLTLDESITIEKVREVKQRLLNLLVPAELKDLHLNFVLAISRMENYLNSRLMQEKNFSRQLINKLKADYGWLNE